MHLILTDSILDRMSERGVHFSLDGSRRLKAGDVLFFSEGLRIEPNAAALAGSTLPSFGSFSYSWSPLPDGLVTGRYCSISWNLQIIAPNHPTGFVSTSSFTYDDGFVIFSRPLQGRRFDRYPQAASRPNRNDLPVVGHDVWIGQDVTLARGITLGNGCVIGARSVVTRSVPPFAIVGGNPARVIRMRFADAVIERLLASAWWTYSFVDFGAMRYDEPETFLDQLAAAVEGGQIGAFTPPVLTASELVGFGVMG